MVCEKREGGEREREREREKGKGKREGKNVGREERGGRKEKRRKEIQVHAREKNIKNGEESHKAVSGKYEQQKIVDTKRQYREEKEKNSNTKKQDETRQDEDKIE